MNRWMSMNKWMRLLIVLCLLAIGMLITAGITKKSAQTAREERFRLEFANEVGSAETIVPNGNVKEFNPAKKLVANKRSEQEVRIVDDWFKRVGFSTEPERNYDQQYTDEQLRELVKKGDVIAIDVLAKRLRERNYTQFIDELMRLRNSNDIEGIGKLLDNRSKEGKTEYEFLLEKGIAYGSYNSISALASLYRPYFNNDDSSEERKYQSQRLKDYLSYVGLLELRGVKQLYGAHTDERILLERYESLYGSKLSKEESAEISRKAQELYDHFQNERHKLGLGNFDNELPDEVKKFLGE